MLSDLWLVVGGEVCVEPGEGGEDVGGGVVVKM